MKTELKTLGKISLISLATLAMLSNIAQASESVGTINPSFKIAKVCQDTACSTFGNINFAPTINAFTSGAVAISITDTFITGNAFGDQIGWINMKPTGSGVTVNPSTGALGGFAYSQAGSWINFAPTGYGVTINSAGEFDGWAWVSGAYGGWLKFDCLGVGTCVKTDWRPIPFRTVVTPTPTPTTGGGGLVGAYVTVAPGGATTTIKETEIKPQPVKVVEPLTPETGTTVDSSVPNEGAPSGYQPAPSSAPAPQQTSSSTQPAAETPTPQQNAFDKNNDGAPDITPKYIVENESGDYRQVFPSAGDFKSEPDCLLCVQVKHDTQGFIEGINRGDRYILKFGFVPSSVQVPVIVNNDYIPFTSPEAKTEFTHVDAVSASAAAAAGWAVWRLALVRGLRLLARYASIVK